MKPCPVCWIDFGAPDPIETARFYTEVFGWQFRNDPSAEYHEFFIEGNVGGGIYRSADIPDQSSVTVYIWVDDIDDSIGRIQKHGGKLTHPKTAIREGSSYAQFKDPVGNLFGLYECKK